VLTIFYQALILYDAAGTSVYAREIEKVAAGIDDEITFINELNEWNELRSCFINLEPKILESNGN